MTDDKKIEPCKRCNGTKKIKIYTGVATDEWIMCPVCQGTGKKRI